MTLKAQKESVVCAREQFQKPILILTLVTEREVFPQLRSICPFSKGPAYPQRYELLMDKVVSIGGGGGGGGGKGDLSGIPHIKPGQ